jgi:hypothetical protein
MCCRKEREPCEVWYRITYVNAEMGVTTGVNNRRPILLTSHFSPKIAFLLVNYKSGVASFSSLKVVSRTVASILLMYTLAYYDNDMIESTYQAQSAQKDT